MSNQRKQWNDENLHQVVETLIAAQYQCGRQMKDKDGTRVEFWIGPGIRPVIVVQVYAQDMGFELLTPLTTEQKMTDVIEVLKQATMSHNIA